MGVFESADVKQFGERLAEAMTDAEDLRSRLASEAESRGIAEADLSRVRAELSTAEADRTEVGRFGLTRG